jgi:hypothetical protein
MVSADPIHTTTVGCIFRHRVGKGFCSSGLNEKVESVFEIDSTVIVIIVDTVYQVSPGTRTK